VIHSSAIVSPRAELGVEVEVGPCCVIGAGVRIGDRCTLHSHVVIDGSCEIGSGNEFYPFTSIGAATLGGHVTVEDHVIISGLAGIHQFCRLGTHALIGGCTKIVQDVPPYLIADGHPARLRGVNLVGLQRRGFPPESIRSLKAAYRALFLHKEANLAGQLAAFESSDHARDPQVRTIIEFLRRTERGVVR